MVPYSFRAGLAEHIALWYKRRKYDNFNFYQVLCPRCDIGTSGFKRKTKKTKESVPNGKKKSTKLESLCDLERALSECKETVAAVCIYSEKNLMNVCA